mgnify:CR=1 FL=1
MSAAGTVRARGDAASDESPDIDVDVARRLGTRRGMLASVGGSAIARLTVMPVSALLGIVVTRLILDNYGEATYAQYTQIGRASCRERV